MARRRVEQHLVMPLGPGAPGGRRPEDLLVEEPLEIRVGDDLVATTMRTPGHDFELAVGFLHAEGRLAGPPSEVRYCATGSAAATGFNVVTVDPGPAALRRGEGLAGDVGDVRGRPARLGLTSSSCGICGAEQIEALVERLDPLPAVHTYPVGILAGIAPRLAAAQELFAATGGSHAAAALDAEGEVLVVREDIGRHNAVDKVVGRLVLDGALPLAGHVLWVSGRASFEIVQKAWAAGFGALVAVGAVSALAAATAGRAGMVLCGFAREGRLTVHAGDSLVTGGPP
jgi:FdhD protein